MAAEGNAMPGRRRFAALSLTALLALAGCATESPGPEDRTVAAPVLSPQPGTYSAAMDVALTTATLGASIRYTTDGSTPSETAGTVYLAPVRVDATSTIKAVAFRTGWTTSEVSTGLYTIRPLAAPPVFDPAPGTYHDAQDVVMTTATAGASIRYTADGSTPTAASGTLYAGPVHVAANTVLRAVAFGTDLTTSVVAWGQYVIGPAVTAPAFAPPPGAYEGPQNIVLTSLTAGASIRYTTDGSDPSETAGTLYAAPVRLPATTTLKAVAFRAGWDTSPVTSGLYTISTLVAAPVFAPPPGTYDEAQNVAITTSTAGASIRYTTDGTAPTESLGTVYTGPVAVPGTLTLRAVAYRAGWTTSSVTSGLYTIEPPGPGYAQYAYVANADGQTVSAYEIDAATGVLTPLAGSPFAAGGTGPWCLAAHPSGEFLYVLNYASRNVSIMAIDAATGALAETPDSPVATGGASPSWIAVEPAGKFLYVADSAANSVSGFAVDAATGRPTALAGGPASTALSPACIAVAPSGKFLFAACSGAHAVSAFALDGTTGALAPVAGSPFTTDGQSPTAVAADPSGLYLFAANGATDNVTAFAVEPTTGALAAVAGSPFPAGGTAPAFAAVDPAGRFVLVANAGSTLSAFALSGSTGALTPVPGSPFAADGVYPRSIAFERGGKFAYAANAYSGTVSSFAVDPASGALAAVAGSPFAAGNGPYSVVTIRVAR